MKKKNVLIAISFVGLMLFASGLVLNWRNQVSGSQAAIRTDNTSKDTYYCPMHPNFTSDKPGSCAICGMTLVKKEKAHEGHSPTRQEKKILYYRNPMNPQVTSPVPMKDSMGMDYVPVYEEEAGTQESGIYISPEKQQLIGLKKEAVQKRQLIYQILTVGKVAYDPALFVAQEEYLQALKARERINEGALPLIKEQTEALVDAARRKLLLLGMGAGEIVELAKKGKPQENLYLPLGENKVWIYITIYEYEIGLVKEGMPVEIEAVAFPGEVFRGKIVAITPVLNPETRSVQVRAEIQNPSNKLKPEMFVNAKIRVNLGNKLAVPESAVLDTGLRKVVYLVKEGGMFESRDVLIGQKTDGYYEVLEGLREGDVVVTSGNFLVDSESKLKGAVQESGHKHGQ